MLTSRCLANDWKSRGSRALFYRVLGTLVVPLSVSARPPPCRNGDSLFQRHTCLQAKGGIPCCRINPPWQEFLTLALVTSTCHFYIGFW